MNFARSSRLLYVELILFSLNSNVITGLLPLNLNNAGVHPATRSCTFFVNKRSCQDTRYKRQRRISSQRTDQDDDTTSSFDMDILERDINSSNGIKNKTSPLVTIQNKISDSFSHLTSKDLGSRRELYVVPQFILVFSILTGKLPFYTEVISTLFGPVIFLLGLLVMGLAIKEMGGSFTAYPVPVPKEKGGVLIKSGIFSFVRHPIYAGNLFCFIGLSIMTESSMRLLLTAFYYAYVEIKSKKEEGELLNIYGEQYSRYKEEVCGKFVPQKILSIFSVKSNVTSEEAWQ